MRQIFALFAALCLLVFVAPLALAQGGGVVSRSSWLYDLWTIVQPLAVLLVSTVGPALVAWISYRLAALLKINDQNAQKEFEAKLREALHAAALNGLKYAMTRAGLPAGSMPTAEILSDAIDYVRTKSPDTAAQAGIDDVGLQEIILSKVPDVIGMLAKGGRK